MIAVVLEAEERCVSFYKCKPEANTTALPPRAHAPPPTPEAPRELAARGSDWEQAGAEHALIGRVCNVSARGRLAVQLKSQRDCVSILSRDAIASLAASLPLSAPRVSALPDEPTQRSARADNQSFSHSGAGESWTASSSGLQAAGVEGGEQDEYTAPFGGRKVFIGGTRELDSDVIADKLRHSFGPVASVRTYTEKFRDGGSAPRGFAFATFYDARDARRACAKARVTYKKGCAFAKMEVKACDGALRKVDNDYDVYTAQVLRDADAKSAEERRARRLAALSPAQVRQLEAKAERTRIVALDCEMVGVGEAGRRNNLARVALVNAKGQSVYSRFVKPVEAVTDYRARITGLSAANLTAAAGAVSFDEARGVVSALIRGRVVVGHALRNDFKVLDLVHPVSLVRDTSRYQPLRLASDQGKTPSLRALAARVLGQNIQAGVHDPALDARTALALYQRCAQEWERSVASLRQQVGDRIARQVRRRRR